MTIAMDIEIDWNGEDDTGVPWTFVDRAESPRSDMTPGSTLRSVASGGQLLLASQRRPLTSNTAVVAACVPHGDPREACG